MTRGKPLLRATVDPAAVERGIPFALHHAVVAQWLTGLGLDDVRTLAVFDIDGRYQLHVTEMVRNERDEVMLDQASDAVVTRPRVVDLGTEPAWPECLNDAHYRRNILTD